MCIASCHLPLNMCFVLLNYILECRSVPLLLTGLHLKYIAYTNMMLITDLKRKWHVFSTHQFLVTIFVEIVIATLMKTWVWVIHPSKLKAQILASRIITGHRPMYTAYNVKRSFYLNYVIRRLKETDRKIGRNCNLHTKSQQQDSNPQPSDTIVLPLNRIFLL